MPEYKVLKDGKEYKAPDIQTLKRWVEERRIRPEDRIYHPVSQKWIYVKDMEELEEEIKKLYPWKTRSWSERYMWPLGTIIAGFIIMLFQPLPGFLILITGIIVLVYRVMKA